MPKGGRRQIKVHLASRVTEMLGLLAKAGFAGHAQALVGRIVEHGQGESQTTVPAVWTTVWQM